MINKSTKGTQAKVELMNERLTVSFSIDIEYIKQGKAIWIGIFKHFT